MLPGSKLARLYNASRLRLWASPDGMVIPCVLPSWFSLVAFITARMGSPSLCASASLFKRIPATPSPRAYPSPEASNDRHLPEGLRNPNSDIWTNISGLIIKFAPHTRAILDSPALRAIIAWWSPTIVPEQAVSIEILAPCRSNT